MQNMDTRDFQKLLKEYGYKQVRHNGGSHVVYEREETVKDTISIPQNSKTVNGPMASRLVKQMQDFEDWVCRNTRGVKG